MFPPRPTHILHMLLGGVIRPGDTVIDATAGNGHDTVFLAEAVGPDGRVIAVDIQEQAIRSTADRLRDAGLHDRVELHQCSHTGLWKITTGESVAAIVFNLGYLPGADHAVITESETTVDALAISAFLLKPGGVLAVTCYPGHAGGDREARAVEGFFRKKLNFRTAKYEMISTGKASPFLLIASKTTLEQTIFPLAAFQFPA